MYNDIRPVSILKLISRYMISLFFMTGFALPALSASNMLSSNPPGQILGWLETVRIDSFSQPIEAKIDSGADHSSLHASNITQFDLDGQTWIRFTTVNQNTLTKPVVRSALIKQKQGRPQQRPVVEIRLCLNSRLINIPINLVDRSTFKQPMLIGRSALLKGILIDPNRVHLTRPDCPLQLQ